MHYARFDWMMPRCLLSLLPLRAGDFEVFLFLAHAFLHRNLHHIWVFVFLFMISLYVPSLTLLLYIFSEIIMIVWKRTLK